MATPGGDHVLIDTNVLLAATDEARNDHVASAAVLSTWPARGFTCYTSGQILREYLVVATRPAAVNGLGMSRGDALNNVAVLRDRLRFLPESEKVHVRLLELLSLLPCTGKHIHDANIAATALAHGVTTVVTRNTDDFRPFGPHLRVVDVA